MNNSFIMLHGELTVSAQGYWYTNGGEKGSFGYYPHLKNNQQHPIYPDTQIHGDLRMAAQWLAELNPEKGYSGLIKKLFGDQGSDLNSLLFLQDLTLSATAQKKWSPARFDIKSRIEIEDSTRTVKPKMLMSFEAAWLNGLTLKTNIYAGYFTDVSEADLAKKLLEEAVTLVSGFGAFRSRGYGRGNVNISWQPHQQVDLDLKETHNSSFRYALKNLVNMRSKPIATERLQLVTTNNKINAEQLRGWFVRTYKNATGKWPQIEDMAKITFSDLIPSPSVNEPAYSPANTILRREDGTSIDDYWGKTPQNDSTHDAAEETPTKCKLKPLKAGTYITATGKIVNTAIGVRLRNAIQDNFRTLDEGGLFVQQYVAQGTIFCGQITLADENSDFGRIAGAILTRLKPILNGTIFEATINTDSITNSASHSMRLVSMPIAFDTKKERSADEGITIGTLRRYAPALGRPKRGIPVILPGSIIADTVKGTIDWPLFGKNIEQNKHTEECAESYKKDACSKPLPDSNITWGNITRSQAGVLRELLHHEHNCDVIDEYLVHIYEKHEKNNHGSDLTKLYKALVDISKKDGIDGLRATINNILEYLKVEIWWKEKYKDSNKGGQQ